MADGAEVVERIGQRFADAVTGRGSFRDQHWVEVRKQDLLEVCGDREVAVCREMTKLHEEVWRGSLAGAVEAWTSREVRGEVTVVLGGAAPPVPDLEEAVGLALRAVESGTTPSDAVKDVAARTGVRRRELYEALLRQL